MRALVFTLILVLAAAVPAQSGRVGTVEAPQNPANDLTVKQMFDEANLYAKTKYNEYAEKKIPYSDTLLEQTKREQRQLAAKYAAIAGTRQGLSGDDFYYLGMLHWIAENLDGTIESLTKYTASDAANGDRMQNGRSILVIALAKQKKTADAEKILAEYISKAPFKLAERARMDTELAKSYQQQKDFAKMVPHAESAYSAAKDLLKEAASRARALDEIIDTGMLVFEAYRDLGERSKADSSLDDMIATARATVSTSFYYFAVDQKIRYMIETGRKTDGLALYRSTVASIDKIFSDQGYRDDVARRFEGRDKHYKLLGERAPELPAIDQWFPGKPRPLADYKGKVLLLDFWATWCGPCYGEFGEFKDWLREFGKDGFEILGITRYYSGEVDGIEKTKQQEIEYLKGVISKEGLPFDTVVARDQSIQFLYGGTLLPTAVLIDRKGTVRYIETGASPLRIAELRDMLVRLIAEK